VYVTVPSANLVVPERSAASAPISAPGSARTREVLIFELGSQRYGLPTADVRELPPLEIKGKLERVHAFSLHALP